MGSFASHPSVFVSVDSIGYMVYFRRRLRAGKFKTVKRLRKTKKY
jgi:hypothetical protein